MIGVVGYGMGNVQSVVNALDHLGLPNFVAGEPAALDRAGRILLPGVGAFGKAMDLLEETGFATALREQVEAKGKPLLGICLGMQLLASHGTEFGERAGLGLVPGRVVPIPRRDPSLRLPHMGWNELERRGCDPLLEGLGEAGEAACYFVHGFHLEPEDPAVVTSVCDYGGPVTATVALGRVHGAQFHPEKSQAVGLRLLSNFAALPC